MHRILITDKGFVDVRYFSDWAHYLNSLAMYADQGYRVYGFPAEEVRS